MMLMMIMIIMTTGVTKIAIAIIVAVIMIVITIIIIVIIIRSIIGTRVPLALAQSHPTVSDTFLHFTKLLAPSSRCASLASCLNAIEARFDVAEPLSYSGGLACRTLHQMG